jgi:hypothetical protein
MESVELLRILDAITALSNSVQNLKDLNKNIESPYKSIEINDLSTSLAKAQGEFKTADLNKGNPYFKSRYADLMSVVNASRPALTKYGLSVVQDIIAHDDGQSVLHTILLHSTGQWIESRMRIVPPKNDIQTISSYTTYLKRMAYASLVGVVTGDEDDDGEVAMVESRDTFAKGIALNTKYNPREISPETISKDQLAELEYELAEYPDIASQLLDGLKIQSVADMPKEKYHVSIKRVREIKQIRNNPRG